MKTGGGMRVGLDGGSVGWLTFVLIRPTIPAW
jgi:hypothetical protein